MDQGYLEVPREMQLDQLPEGTEVQVGLIPVAFSYKKVDGLWVPIQWDPMPLVEDCFSLGTIAIDPDGVEYVKGFTECFWHTAPSMTACLCARPIRWLRAGRMPCPVLQVSPLDDSNVPQDQTYLNRYSTLGGTVIHPNFPESCTGIPIGAGIEEGDPHLEPYLPSINGYDYVMGGSNYNLSDNRVTEVEHQISSAYGHSEDDHRVFNNLQVSSAAVIEQTPINDVAFGGLQHIQGRLVPDGFTIHFNWEGDGILLDELDTLDNDWPAFRYDASLGTKASIRFKFGCWQNIPGAKRHADRRKQVNVRHGRCKSGIPISLRAIAEHVRSEVVAEMNTMADLGYPLSHRGALVTVEELVLVRIERIKPGTLQPVFSLR